ncbi:hypothetical protein [Sphingomonas sp. BK580]|uniref:hypothetical protein n=1 Tax=Sphingomonas sp. BK580 TaxID=2586972 RepID=UPI001620EA8A|nr:hypothetical protein [Sphingomonas sp. BK580]MBB3695231.1 hypothetical protein [Sphingomonas sp. BK580]
MALPFDVEAFSEKALHKALVAHSHGQNAAVAKKPQVRFLFGYLKELGCRTMIVERGYTDRNFLEDYAAYYVRCFEQYSRVCTRLHFVAREIDEKAVSAAIVADDAAALQEHYLGFLVIKPLPLTVIGRTCLLPYPATESRPRVFPTVQPQAVDLYGLKLQVETLPFQEQDREVAACASSALWTMLHSTSRLFQHAMPSPVEITKAATAHARVDGRTFPNGGGLNALQIADAIRSVGLEPFGIGVTSIRRLAIQQDDYAEAVDPSPEGAAGPAGAEAPVDRDGEHRDRQESQAERAAQMQLELKIAVLAYMRSGIACALLARTTDQVGGELMTRGNHAVAITGFSLADHPAQGYGTSGTRFAAARLDRLYVHDDQTGPFTRFMFEDGNMLAAEDFSAPDVDRRLAEPVNLVVPLYHKIRIPLRQVVGLTVALDGALAAIARVVGLKDPLEWDIQLIGLEAFRDAVSAGGLPSAAKLDLLTASLPRFLWRVTAALPSKPVFELLLDATDLLQGNLVRRLVTHDPKLCNRISYCLSLSQDVLPDTLRPTVRAFEEARTAKS